MSLMEFLPMLVYILLIVLLVILIIIGIKVIFVIDKTENLLNNIQEKVNSFNSIFKLIDMTSNKLSMGISSIVENIIYYISKIFKRKGDNDYE